MRNKNCHLSKIPKIVAKVYFQSLKSPSGLCCNRSDWWYRTTKCPVYAVSGRGRGFMGGTKKHRNWTWVAAGYFPFPTTSQCFILFLKAWPDSFPKPKEVFISITIATKTPTLIKSLLQPKYYVCLSLTSQLHFLDRVTVAALLPAASKMRLFDKFFIVLVKFSVPDADLWRVA